MSSAHKRSPSCADCGNLSAMGAALPPYALHGITAALRPVARHRHLSGWRFHEMVIGTLMCADMDKSGA